MSKIAMPRDANALADELAIRELVTRYADAVTDYDEKAWAETWAEDGRWELLGQSANGRDAVVALWKQLMPMLEGVIQVAHSGIVDLDGDSASARWTIAEYGRLTDGATSFLLGRYRDRYRRESDGWRFVERRMEPLYMGPIDLSGALLPNRR